MQMKYLSKFSKERMLLKHGVRSGLEGVICKDLNTKGVAYEYEKLVLPYIQPEQNRKYTPDIRLLDSEIIVEIKGRWVTSDRQKISLIKKQYPHIDFRMVFSNSKTKISKISKTTYGDYCDKLGIPYADKRIPDEWLKEKK